MALPLRLYCGLLLGLWGISALPLLLRSAHLWSAQPLWFQPPFYDFGCYYDRIKFVHHPEFWTVPGPVWDYPAPNIFVYQLFYLFNRGNPTEHKVFFGFLAYLTFAAAALLVAGIGLAQALHRRGLPKVHAYAFMGVSLLLCWPVFFGMQRGNIEFFLDAGIALAVFAYVHKRWWLFAILIGVFGSGKLYPILLLSLLLPLRRWKQFFLGLAVAAGVTLFATRWIGPPPIVNHQAHGGVLNGLVNWIHSNSLHFELNKTGYDHSIFALLKLLIHRHPDRFGMWALGYASIAMSGMLLLFFGKVWKLPRPNQLLVVTAAAVLLPLTSFDYTLMLMLPAWAWLALIAIKQPADPQIRFRMAIVMATFAFLFAPEVFASWRGVLFAGQLKMLALLALMAFAATVPWPEDKPSIRT